MNLIYYNQQMKEGGHLPSTRERADLLLSFGRLTLPHMLMRAVLAEQIYRIQTIINHHPYHRE